MTPSVADFISISERDLEDARAVLAANVPHQAGRLAYYSMLHASQALVLEQSNRRSKTHKGAIKLFSEVAPSVAGLDQNLAATLSSAYKLKTLADYETGAVAVLTTEGARKAIADADSFLAQIRAVLNVAPPSGT